MLHFPEGCFPKQKMIHNIHFKNLRCCCTTEKWQKQSKSSDNVRLIDRKVLSSIYPAMNSSFFSSVTAVFYDGQPLVYTFIPSFIPNMILLKGFQIHISL